MEFGYPEKATKRLAGRFLGDAKICLWEASRESLPEAMEADDAIRLSGRRLLEASAEHCDAMDLLQAESLHRPAHALLRVLLETIACFVWLAADPAPHGPLLWGDRRPPFRNLLERIGWVDEYDRTYRSLSEFIHPTEDRLHMYRKMDSGSGDGLAPEIQPDGEIYVLPDVEGVPYLSFSPMTHQEAEDEYGLYVRAKAMDLVLAGMLDVFGEQATSMHWWPTPAVEEFGILLRQDKDLATLMLNRLSG